MYGAHFSAEITVENANGSHACSLQVSRRVANGIPLGCPLFSPVHTVNSVQTLKAISTILHACVGPGDEVLIPDPCWVNYTMATTMRNATPVHYTLSPALGWKPDPAEIRSLITPRTKVMMLCSPSNPTGAVFTKEELMDLVNVAQEHNLVVVSTQH
jgi:histidinol-phosphate/aromatic aminotransferase/cobyric acid decarboxylase-like protein